MEIPRAPRGAHCSPAKMAGELSYSRELAPRAGLLGRALRGFRKFRRDRRGLFAGPPARRLAAVTPRPRPVEGVDAELVHLLHLVDPGRPHPIGVVGRRLADFRQPELAVEARFRDLLGAVPHVGLADHFRIVVAGKTELAG